MKIHNDQTKTGSPGETLTKHQRGSGIVCGCISARRLRDQAKIMEPRNNLT